MEALDEDLQRSIAISEFFKKLSLQITYHLPDKLVQHLRLYDTDARVPEIQKMMDDVLHITSKASMGKFLQTYIPKISDANKHNDELVTYLSDTNAFRVNLERATHLDIKDMVNALKKGVLKQLFELVLQSKSDVLDIDDSCHSVRKKLTSYDWICRLSCIQNETQKLLQLKEAGKIQERVISTFLAEVGIDQSLVAQLSIEDALSLLCHYGIIELTESGQKNHKVITIKAANLSLNDLLMNGVLSTSLLLNSNEIRFLCTECFYLDASTNATWAAKNIVIKAAKIHVKTDNCRIDVSGADGAVVSGNNKKASDGQISECYGPGADGSHGKRGKSGQSGGNILFCTDEIIHLERLNLRSCGGDGSDGQDGGDGQNGKAKPSESDVDWPNNFAHFKGADAHQKILSKVQNYIYNEKMHVPGIRLNNNLFGKSPSGVRILFGCIDSFCYRYGFLLSLSKDGESADGGNPGIGGWAGGGGQAGVISITKLDGRPYANHLQIQCQAGQDGKLGEDGKCGKRSIAERKTDLLHVDGAGPWGTTATYRAFINVETWKHSSKTGQLGSGEYYCKKEVSKQLYKSIDDGYIGFFKTSKKTECPTKYNRQAVHGKANEESRITTTTPTKSIDQATVNLDYQLFANRTLELQDHTALFQSLEHMLHEKLQELETSHEKQHQKQMRRVNHAMGNHSVDLVHIKSISKGTIAEVPIPFEPDKLKRAAKSNPWISQNDITFFQSNIVAAQDKYYKIREIIQNRLDVLQQQNLIEAETDKETTSQFARLTEKWKSSSLSPTDSHHICKMLDAIFLPIVHIMHFEYTQDIDDGIRFLSIVQQKIHSQYQTLIKEINASINHLLFKQYHWCILADIHNKHFKTILSADQSKAVAVYRRLLEQTSIEQLNEFALSLCELKPYQTSLSSYGSLCNTILPLRKSTQKALEILMIFINDNNTGGTVYFPDILSAVQEEYATFHCTITDPDLLFIITYLQDKLKHLMGKAQLEDLFCDGVLSKVSDHTLKSDDYIIYKGQAYQIDGVDQSDHQVSQSDLQVNKSCHLVSINTKSKNLDHETHSFEIYPDRATFDGAFIAFPNAELLVSPIDINAVWNQLQQTVFKDGWIPDDKALEIMPLPDDDHKDKLIALLRQAREAQDIPYSVFSFYPPSQWVEQLIFYVIRTHYQDRDPNFVADVHVAISGLSLCVDKTLYFTFFNQFLHGFVFKNKHYSTDILETLQIMKSVFIDRQLCTLVTNQGITQAWPNSRAETISADLEDSGLIDGTGIFLSHVTSHTLQSYCQTHRLSPNYLNTIHTMQQYTRDLSDKELSFWSHKLQELRLRLDLQDMVEGDIDDKTFDNLVMYAQQLVRNYGSRTVSKFTCALISKQEKAPAELLQDLFEKCTCREWIFDIVIEQLIQKASQPLKDILDHLQNVYDWKSAYKQQRTAVEIIANIKSQLTKDNQALSSKLDDITTKLDDIKRIEKMYSHVQSRSDVAGNFLVTPTYKYTGEDINDWAVAFMKSTIHDALIPFDHHSHVQSRSDVAGNFLVTPICEYTGEDIKDWAVAFRKSTIRDAQIPFDHHLFAEAFAVIRRAVTLFFEDKGKKGIVPRDTHMVASLLFLKNLSVAVQGTHLMQQISTREGKTTIICMTAIFKALMGEKVDIITSSSVLATRDAEVQNYLYSLFDISVSHCCHQELAKRRQAYGSDVIYGDIASFQRDILETNFYGRMVRTDHGFDNILIDEVDSMLVDKGETMLYLPHALPDLNTLDQVYLEIWSLVNAQDFIGFPDEQDQLLGYLNHKLLGRLPTNAFTAIPDITEAQSLDIHCRCIDMGLVDRDDPKDSDEIMRQICSIDAIPSQLRQEVMMIIQQHLKETTPLIQTIPKSLHPFVKKSLKSWIQSAVNAKYFQPNKQYIIDIDHRESAGDRYPKIIIMDNETGVEQESSEWGSGLHQFLQLKHHLRLSTESLKAVYMSNISFFTSHYINIMGVTGTLGSNAEHTLFNKLYENTRLMVLLTNTPSQLRIDPPICCPSIDQWKVSIGSDVQEKLDRGRAVLLICEDVERARYLQKYFRTKNSHLDPELYTSSHQEKLEVTGDSKPGRLIISTNLAGRGTDLKLSKTVKDNGGLHVCLSYLPPNVRVEQQAYGRAARMGDPGSCKLIFHDKQGDLNYAIQKRDSFEAQRVADIEADYYHNILFQEELFGKFTDEFKKIKAKYEDKPDGRPKLDYCLDCWAYFLDRYTDAIESIPSIVTDKARELEKKRLRGAFDKEVKREIDPEQLMLSPARLMQLGHTYMKQAVKQGDKYKDAGNTNDYEAAISAYQKVKVQNPRDPFSNYYEAAAQFNIAIKVGVSKEDRSKLKQAFYQLIPLFQDKIRECRGHISKLQLANRHQDQSLTAGTLYFDEQKQHEMEVYQQFVASMQDVIGKDITTSIFDHPDWGEDGAQAVFQMVKKMFPLKECRVSPRYLPRLKALLNVKTSYHTYQSKIEKKVEALMQQTPVTRDHFELVFPDKCHFWEQLKQHKLITHEPVVKLDGSTERIGYWNPTVNTKDVEFDAWDCIDANSFNWIDKFSDLDRKDIVSHLKANHMLNEKGKLIDFNLAKRIDLPKLYAPYCKDIKDTLWIHSIYQFVLDHLQDCVVIDMAKDIEDSSSSGVALPPQKPNSLPTSYPVVDIIISMNPTANASSASGIQHIQAPSSGEAAPSSGEAALSLQPVMTNMDHIPNGAFNDKFLQQLHEHSLRATTVSGDGLNCMINAMIQHAKRDYQTHCFKEDADIIRKHLQQQHLEISGMLHVDDHCAEAILTLVNDRCCSHSKIKTVSVVIASSDGPIIYGGTHDKRHSSGRHVVIWQQGNHYVSIVHHNDMAQATSQGRATDPEIQKPVEVPKLTQHQLRTLQKLGIVKKRQGGNYAICAGLDAIDEYVQKSSLLSNEDKEKVCAFLRLKLEIDFKTLNRSPRQLAANQHHVLYDDLCQYAVIKPVKMKRNADDIESVSYDRFGYKGRVSNKQPYFDLTVLNDYLKQKKIKELDSEQQSRLMSHLLSQKIIFKELHLTAKVTYRVCFKDDKLPHVLQSATFLSKKQQEGVKDYLRLMIQLKENVETIISTLKNQQSTIRELDTPEITLRKLSDVFDDSVQDKGDVLGWFSDNQCDLIIDLAEQKWSWKTILTAIGAIALGVAQIALGAVLLATTAGTGAFFCNALISEGISDMIFGIEGLVKGHCNWTQYWDNKVMSLAITVATAGVGALFARGREGSKYAYKGFGNASKQLMKETAKETGESVSKIIAKQVVKNIGKNVADASVNAGINLATDAILDQLSGVIQSMSDSLIDCFDTMCKDQELSERMSTFLRQQDKENAERYLHQVTTKILQRRTFLDLWDDIENGAQKGTSVLTNAHGNATAHLQMRGEKLKGSRFMKGIGHISRFAPLVTDLLKGGMIKVKMEKVRTDLIHDLEERVQSKHEQSPLDETRIKEIKDKEIAAMKSQFSQEMSQHGKSIVKTGIRIVGQELKKQAIKVGKEHVINPLKGHIDVSQFNNYEQNLQAAKSDQYQFQEYEINLQRLMARTRSPEVFAQMIEYHDALLGPAFAVPALEKLVHRPIQIKTDHGKSILNVQQDCQQDYAQKKPIVVKPIPGTDDYFWGEDEFTAQEHGNNCLIKAVLAGAGKSDMQAGEVRKIIADACRDPQHPCHDYIKRGIDIDSVRMVLHYGLINL